MIDERGLGDTQIAQKLQLGSAAAQATASGERAFGALKAFRENSPGPQLTPEAAATLMAQLQVGSVKSMDKRNALSEARSKFGNFEVQQFNKAFDDDYDPGMYNDMRDAIKSIYLGSAYKELMDGISSGPGTENYKRSTNVINEIGRKKGIPNLSRAFTGRYND